eukprot:275429-Chlamydomonas_euryale.AAC.1
MQHAETLEGHPVSARNSVSLDAHAACPARKLFACGTVKAKEFIRTSSFLQRSDEGEFDRLVVHIAETLEDFDCLLVNRNAYFSQQLCA